MRNKTRKHNLFILGIAFSCLLSAIFIAQTTFATDIPSSKVKQVGSFKANNYGIQGGTITEKYYIFADSNSHGDTNGSTTLRFIDRKTKKEAKADSSLIGQNFKHSSSVHYDWGTGYGQVADAGSGSWWCFDVNNRKQVSDDKCKNGFIRSGGLSHGSNETYRQGWTKYGDHYFRAYGNESLGANIEVYDKDRNFLENFVVPLSATDVCEIEDVAVDGSEGVLYMLCDDKAKGHHAGYYKIDKSVFSKYISPSSSSSGGGVDIFGNNVYNPEDDNVEIRDESYSTEAPVDTYDGIVDTNFFGSIKDESGCGVYTTLTFVINMITAGIGVAAVIGITICGITYMTSKGDVARTTKAKRRIYEIIIGLVAYAVVYALLYFLTPEFNPELKVCKALTEEEIVQIQTENAKRVKEEQEKNRLADEKRREAALAADSAARRKGKGQSSESCMKNAAKVVRDQICSLPTVGERISKTANIFASSKTTYQQAMKEIGAFGYGGSYGQTVGSSCDTFVYTTIRASGVDPSFPINSKNDSANSAIIYNYLKNHPAKWSQVTVPSEGDIMVKPKPSANEMGHVSLVIKNSKGKLVTAEASNPSTFPYVSSKLATPGSDLYRYVFHFVGK